MVMLGVPAFGLTFGVTILTAFLPTILNVFVSPVIIGLIIGAEGFFGLFVPLIFGVLADRSQTVAGRWTYLVPATAAMAAALVLMGLFHNIFVIGFMVALFYFGYFAYLAPYWATYPDLIPKSYAGRSRSAESSWRVTGAFVALVSGGFLLTLWRPLAFIVSAGLVVGVTIIFSYTIRKYYRKRIVTHHDTIKGSLASSWRMLKDEHDIRNLLIANSFWNATLQIIQAFTVLFFTQGLGRSAHFVSGVIFPVAAIGILIMAPLSGKLADKYGHRKILLISCIIYGVGALAPVFTLRYWVIAVIPIVSGAAAALMTLPYSALMKLINGQPHGAISGLFGISRGIGTFLGPIVAGAIISLGGSLFKATHGYAGEWLAAGLFILISLPFLLRIKSPEL
jgi:MFS family permease